MFSTDSSVQLTGSFQELCIPQILEDCARQNQERIAVAAAARAPLTYGRLLTQIQTMVMTLNATGVGRNDRVAIVLTDGMAITMSFLAVACCATAAPLNPAYSEAEFDFYLSDLNVKALMVQSGTNSPAKVIAKKRGISVLELSTALEAEAGIFRLGQEGHSPAAQTGYARPGDVALVLHTSGTTARPKIVLLTQANVCASARNIQAALGLSESDRCLNTMPLFHIHGLMVTLSSLLAGASICPERFEPQSFFRCLDEFTPTWYTAVPTVHQAILRLAASNQEIINRSRLRFIRSSSSALPCQVAAGLEQVFRTPMLESYGMTEAALQITSNPLPPRMRKFGSVGLPAGPEVAVMDQEGNILSPGERGEIVIRGANVFTGYEGGPEANVGTFIKGWFRTGDEGFIDVDGYVFITGRLKELINRGGEKISPYEVENVLLDHPAVAQAVTFAVPHTALGEDVAAAVVLRENSSTTEWEIREFARGRLAEFKVPRRVRIVDEIPKGPTGKLQRIGLAERLGLSLTRDPASYVPPRETVEHQLVQIWEELLGVSPIGIRDNFFELGGYSLLAVQMLRQVEQVCGRRLPLQALFDEATVERLAQALLAQQAEESRSFPLIKVQSGNGKPPFFFLHGDFRGGGLYCLNLARGLGEDQPFYTSAPYGADGGPRPPRPATVEAIAAGYLEMLRAVEPHGPYILGGLCHGGLVAYEMAQQLRRQGEKVDLVVMIGPAPSNPPGLRYLQDLVYGVGSLLGLGPEQQRNLFLRVRDRSVRLRWMYLNAMSEMVKVAKLPLGKQLRWPLRLAKKLVRHVVSRWRAEGPAGNPGEAGSSEGLRQLHRVIAGYVRHPYSGRVALFWPIKVPVSMPDEPVVMWDDVTDRSLGWSQVASDLEIHEIPGGYETAVTRHIDLLADRMKACLNGAQTNGLHDGASRAVPRNIS